MLELSRIVPAKLVATEDSTVASAMLANKPARLSKQDEDEEEKKRVHGSTYRRLPEIAINLIETST